MRELQLCTATDQQLLQECSDRDLMPLLGAEDRADWEQLADDIRHAARTDHRHLEVLLVGMLDLAGVPRLTSPRQTAQIVAFPPAGLLRRNAP